MPRLCLMPKTHPFIVLFVALLMTGCGAHRHNDPPPGFVALFDGETLGGWRGALPNPIDAQRMSPEQRAAAQAAADVEMVKHWRVESGELVNDGREPNLATARDYGDFELWIDWKILPGGDSGIYLRGVPQVQIWDPATSGGVGSGGLYNNQTHPSKPLIVADHPAGEWNTFHIVMIGERATVELNDQLVVDDVILENYFDRSSPLFPSGPIELQTHGGETRFRNIFIRELRPKVDADEPR